MPYDHKFRTDWDPEPLAAAPAGLKDFDYDRLRWTSTSNGGLLWMTGYWDGSLYEVARGIVGATDAYRLALERLWNRLTFSQTVDGRSLSTPILWDLIQDRHGPPADDGDEAVADLCYMVSASVRMGYGLRSSATSIGHVPDALRDHFHYDPEVTTVRPGFLNIHEMTEEIQWLRPFQMDGWRGHSGHNWVAYGYNTSTDPNRQFKINLGWGGNADPWYSCDEMPFPAGQNYVKCIAPRDVVKFVGGPEVPGTGGPVSPYTTLNLAVALAPDNATLIFKAGSVNPVPPSGSRITRPFKLKGWNVAIRPQ